MARRRGFTLVELMAVVAIIGMLAAIVSVNVMRQVGIARRTTAATEIV
jgi:prepilin-type N-terminal cleavage/methylation domain-containing protein